MGGLLREVCECSWVDTLIRATYHDGIGTMFDWGGMPVLCVHRCTGTWISMLAASAIPVAVRYCLPSLRCNT